MRCLELREWMSLRLDGRLAAPEAALLEAHLDSCPACSQEWRRWQAVESLFRGAPMAQPPEGLAERVMARLRRRPEAKALGGSVAVMGLGLAIVMAVLVVPLVVALGPAVATAVEAPGVLASACGAAASLVGVVVTVVEAARLLVWAVLNSPSLLVASVYAALALGMRRPWTERTAGRSADLGVKRCGVGAYWWSH